MNFKKQLLENYNLLFNKNIQHSNIDEWSDWPTTIGCQHKKELELANSQLYNNNYPRIKDNKNSAEKRRKKRIGLQLFNTFPRWLSLLSHVLVFPLLPSFDATCSTRNEIWDLHQSFDTANQRFSEISGRAEIFQRFYWRFKLAAIKRMSKIKISLENIFQ